MLADAHQEEEIDAFLMRRFRSHIVLLDEQFGIAFAQNSAMEFLSRALNIPKEYLYRFPLPIELAIQDALETLAPGEQVAIEPAPALLFRISKLQSTQHECIVSMLVEPKVQRQCVTATAVARFRLTSREADVLSLLLRGKCTIEIAEDMCIAEATAADHVKRLLRKTVSRNRAELVAKVLGWRPEPALT